MAQRGRATGRQSGRAGGQAAAGGKAAPRDKGRSEIGERPSAADAAARKERLRQVIEPVVAEAGYDLEDLTVKQIGRRHQVRVMIDGDGGVNLDAIAVASRAVSAALDAAEEAGNVVIAGEYQLEVSSPGVDRPLTLPRHWRRNVGRLVSVRLGERTVVGRLTAADEHEVTIEVDGVARVAALADLGPGRVQVEFTRMNEISDEDLEEIDDSDEDVDDEEDEDDEGDER
jgi:ribosome maturation factor RimP